MYVYILYINTTCVYNVFTLIHNMHLSLLRDNLVHQCYQKSQLLKCYAFSQYLTYRSLCVSGFHRNEDMKAIDVLPILKEKVAFLSGQTLTLSTDI